MVAVYANPLFTRRVFAGRDLLAYNLPVEKAVHDAWARGEAPAWLPEISGGRPLLPNPNTGAFYPVRPLLAPLPFPAAMRLFPVVHWIVTGLGMLVWLRSIGCSREAAWIGAVTVVFSGVSVSEIFFPNRQPGSALLPWILWAAARLSRPRIMPVVLLAFLLGLDLLAGDAFGILFALIASALWIGVAVEKSGRLRAFARLAGAGALAALLALPQLAATALWAPLTSRGVSGLKLEEAFFFSVSPLRLLELAVPFPFGPLWQLEKGEGWATSVFHGHGSGLYLSLYAGAFAGIAAVHAWKASGAPVRFARILLAGSVLAAVVPSLLPQAWGSASSPIPLRYPEKCVVPAMFALAMLAALELDRLAGAAFPRWTLLPGIALAAASWFARLRPDAAGGAAASAFGSPRELAPAAGRDLSAALAEAGLLWMVTVLALGLFERRTRPTSVAALLMLTAVPVLANRRIAPTFREDEALAPTRFARWLDRRDPDRRFRVLGESLYLPPSSRELEFAGSDVGLIELPRRRWYEYVHALWGRGTVLNVDYDAGELSRTDTVRRLSHVAARYTDSEPFFGSLALRWAIRFRDQPPMPGYRRFSGDSVQDWDEDPRALPDIRLVSRWREEPDTRSAFADLPRCAPGEVVIETGRSSRGDGAGGAVRVRQVSPARLRIETSTEAPAWLFVLRAYWPYRRVRIDGREAPFFPAQLAYTAVAVPPGRHTVDWEERVPGLEASVTAPVLFALIGAFLLFRDRRAPQAAGR